MSLAHLLHPHPFRQSAATGENEPHHYHLSQLTHSRPKDEPMFKDLADDLRAVATDTAQHSAAAYHSAQAFVDKQLPRLVSIAETLDSDELVQAALTFALPAPYRVAIAAELRRLAADPKVQAMAAAEHEASIAAAAAPDPAGAAAAAIGAATGAAAADASAAAG